MNNPSAEAKPLVRTPVEQPFDLNPRSAPVQARAKKTYENILRAAAELLEAGGFDGLNTNLIAEHAGANISAVYKYFPNKYAILAVLTERLNDSQTELAIEYLRTVDKSASWEEKLTGTIDVMVKGTRNTPGLVALQGAMQATPDLKEVYRRSNEVTVDVLLEMFESSGVNLPPRRKRLIGICLGEIIPTMLDLSVSEGKRFDRKIVTELKRMMIGYIRTYINDQS